MSLLKLPGLIDAHVHLREPGATQKEDFLTGGRAAVRGGFTYIIDMPNNPTPTISLERLEEKIQLSQDALCDIGFHYGTNGENIETFEKAWQHPKVHGLKLYCNHTTGQMLIEDPVKLDSIFKNWETEKPLLVHAEGKQLAMTIEFAAKYSRTLHVCHISLKEEVEMVRKAKSAGQKITAGVCPHHLYLTGKDREKLGSFAIMKPPLGSQEDQDALWEGLKDGTIDIIETDHAPHTLQEKKQDPAPFGVPGLETALLLTLYAVENGRITQQDLINLLYNRPKEIFSLPDQEETFIEVDATAHQKIGENGYETKCGWSPFEGWDLPGVVRTVVIRGNPIIRNGMFVA